MVKTITDLFTTIFLIALAAFLVRNATGTAKVGGAVTNFVTGTVKAVTFQK
jgi:hypothetical protein